MRDYFVPRTRAGLILALQQSYPQTAGVFKYMKLAQLRAIFFRTREKQMQQNYLSNSSKQ